MTTENEKIAKLENELEQLRQYMQSFIYTVSHDLSAPLRTVVAFSELLQSRAADKLDAESSNYLSFIISGGEKAQGMLSALLDYSRLSSNPLQFTKVNPTEVIAQCIGNLDETIAASHAEIQIGSMPEITAGNHELQAAFTALLDNAIKFHKPGVYPKIHISHELTGNQHRFRFSDNGIGVEERFRNEVFNVFRRLHRDSEYPGIGMGLAVAKKVAERHGGIVGIDSSPEGGTEVWVTLNANAA